MISVEEKVKSANKSFYNTVAKEYESIDGRRSETLISYATIELSKIAKISGNDSILDLGCGSGFISQIGKNIFRSQLALDISFNILDEIDDQDFLKITSDFDHIPLKTNSIDCVTTFAVLHHSYSFQKMFKEIYRVLKKGGIFYSDHDMDKVFFDRYRLLLSIYRKLHNAKKNYSSRFTGITDEIYDHSEFHQNGIPTQEIESLLYHVGFESVSISYHWFGLTNITNLIFSNKTYMSGSAPLVKIIAKK